MKIALGSDRNGFATKEKLIKHLNETGHEALDVGPYEGGVPVDYTIYGEKVGKAVATGDCQFGIVVCGTGEGICIAANKVKSIRCGIGYSDYVARQMRWHVDANVISFGENEMAYDDIEKRVDIFLSTEFLGAHHAARVKQLADIENGKEIHPTTILNKNFGRK